MKKSAFMMIAIMGMSASAFANQREVTRCYFEANHKGKSKEGTRCRVKLVDRDEKAATPGEVSKRRDSVELDVDCTNGFHLSDRSGREIEKSKSDWVFASDRRKVALLEIEENSRGRDRDRDNATLIISRDDCQPWEDDTIRLEGRCIEKDDDNL